jgi:hypothetical protein
MIQDLNLEIDKIINNKDNSNRIDNTIIIKESNYSNSELFDIDNELIERKYNPIVMYGI